MTTEMVTIESINGGAEMKAFLNKVIGFPMRLHMSEISNNTKTFIVTSGFIDSILFQDESKKLKVGFRIQLRNRNGEIYHGTENFFGTFEYFEVKEMTTSTMVRVQYKDGSYFDIEVFV